MVVEAFNDASFAHAEIANRSESTEIDKNYIVGSPKDLENTIMDYFLLSCLTISMIFRYLNLVIWIYNIISSIELTHMKFFIILHAT